MMQRSLLIKERIQQLITQSKRKWIIINKIVNNINTVKAFVVTP